MSTSSNQWYVEMSMGITLGPMPFDAVAELAETSAIMRDDRVREGSSKQWKSAQEVPGLFGDGGSLGSDSGVVSLSDFEVTETSPEAVIQASAKPKEAAAAPETADGIVRLGEFEVLLGESKVTAETADEPASALLRAATSLESAEPAAVPLKKAAVPLKKAAVPLKKVERVSKKESGRRDVAESDSNLGSPDAGIPQLDIPAETPQRVSLASAPSPRTVDSRDRSLVATELETVEADSREARPLLDLTALVNEGVEDGMAPTSQSATTTPPPLKPTIQPWRPPVKRNRQLVVRSCLALAAVVAVWLLFSLLKPDMEVATYDQYAAIYLEYRSLAESPGSGSWSEFATRAKTELDETLPDLEASAVPGERSKSLLLYAGRDLRTALDLTPGVTYPHAERLAGFFQQLNELHASSE
jgi:hypothetical protein